MKLKTEMIKLPKELEQQLSKEIQVFRSFVFEKMRCEENEMQSSIQG